MIRSTIGVAFVSALLSGGVQTVPIVPNTCRVAFLVWWMPFTV